MDSLRGYDKWKTTPPDEGPAEPEVRDVLARVSAEHFAGAPERLADFGCRAVAVLHQMWPRAVVKVLVVAVPLATSPRTEVECTGCARQACGGHEEDAQAAVEAIVDLLVAAGAEVEQ